MEPEPNPSGLSVQNADTAKQLTVTQQSQEEVARVKEQLAFQVEQVKRESEMKVRFGAPTPTMPRAPPTMPRARPISTAPCNILSHRVQLEEQSDQLEKIKRELEAKAGELVRVQEALSRTEQVWGLPGWGHRVGSEGPLVWGAAGTSTRGHSGSGIWSSLGSQSLLPSLVGP